MPIGSVKIFGSDCCHNDQAKFVGRHGSIALVMRAFPEAMQSAGKPVPVESKAWLYVGNDPKTNRTLKVIAVPDDRGKSNLTVIHCSPLEWHGDGGEGTDRDD
jgi:hypothetical protein